MKKGYIVLEDGRVFEGERFGAEKNVIGELVFTTGMEGYIETLTDPSYYGQIIMHTFPLIGNYGWIKPDGESDKIHALAYIVREWCTTPSNFRCEGDINTELINRGIPGICGVDTRELTRIIRENGVMNACITDDPQNVDIDELKNYRVQNALKNVSVSGKASVYPACGEEKYKVTLIDYGAKHNIIRCLTKRGCTVKVVPFDTSAEKILADAPDGIMLSNGPGDPSENKECISVIKELAGKLPIFGICLGHQLLALALGADTYKLKYGHRGGNQPVKCIDNGEIYITSQNHGYAVDAASVEKIGGILSFVNANDGTCEGIDYPEKKAFSVQFHPEACSGPKDSEELMFGRFVSMMLGGKN